MPFQSKKQQKFFYVNPEKVGGRKVVEKWSKETDYSKLPRQKKKKEKSLHEEVRLVQGKYGTYFKKFNIKDILLNEEQVESLFDNFPINEIYKKFEQMKLVRDKLIKDKSNPKFLSKISDAIDLIALEANRRKFKKSLHKMPILKANGSISGITTEGTGKGVVTVGMGLYPSARRRKKQKNAR